MIRRNCLLILPDIGTGGAETSLLRLALFLSSYHDVALAIMSPGDDPPVAVHGQFAIPEAIKISLLDKTPRNHNQSSFVVRLHKKFRRWIRMIQHLHRLKKNADICISFLPGAHVLNILSGSNKKSVISQRGSRRFDVDLRGFSRFFWLYILDPYLYRRAAWVICASEGIHREITSRFSEYDSKISYIEGLMNLSEILAANKQPVDPDLCHLTKFDTVVTYGRLHKSKGFDFLIKVIFSIWVSHPRVRLLIIGEGPEFNNLLHQTHVLMKKLRYGGYHVPNNLVTFAGHRPSPYRMLKAGKIFAFPSRNEGLPNALLEAVAIGARVLAADCPWGVRSILCGGKESDQPRKNGTALHCLNGKLLPPPEEPNSALCWEAVLLAELQLKANFQRPYQERLAALRKYDVKQTGQSWLSLIDKLTQNSESINKY